MFAEGLFFAVGQSFGLGEEPMKTTDATDQMGGVDEAEDVEHIALGVGGDGDAACKEKPGAGGLGG